MPRRTTVLLRALIAPTFADKLLRSLCGRLGR
jgi:hypothetical protein